MKINGIKKYCDKEGYIVEIFKNKKEIFKNIIDSNIKHIHSQVRLNNNKIRVDLLGEIDENSMVFVELSIRNSCVQDFMTHRKELINILEIIGKEHFAHIILMSPNFLNEDINELEKLIASYNVKVYFVYIAMDLIFELQNHIHNGSYEKSTLIYNKPTVNQCIKVSSRIVNTDKVFVFPLNNESIGNDISKAILKGLREDVYWHLAVHNYKDLTKSIIRIGSGKGDIMLNIYCGMDNIIRIEVDFADKLSIFNIFKNYLADMCDEIGDSIDIDPNLYRIFTEIPMSENKAITINTAIDTAKGYIEYLTKMYKKIQI
ncbi:hypothetical protein [Clostridium sp.]|jgi:hypothetical protein|uniref:hypothetical protein n=1 Tax=Clostridium sp. TaxID=1506 RepID=UPI003EEFC281